MGEEGEALEIGGLGLEQDDVGGNELGVVVGNDDEAEVFEGVDEVANGTMAELPVIAQLLGIEFGIGVGWWQGKWGGEEVVQGEALFEFAEGMGIVELEREGAMEGCEGNFQSFG